METIAYILSVAFYIALAAMFVVIMKLITEKG